MPSNRLCVFGCVTTGVTIHKFPNPVKFPEQFKMWVDVTGDILKGISDEQIFKLKKVCDKHFMDSHKNRYNRLNALAVPVKHIYKPLAAAAEVNSKLNMNLEADLPSSSKQITAFSTTAALEHSGPCMIPRSDLPLSSQQTRGPSFTAPLKNPGPCMISPSDLPCSSQQVKGPSSTAAWKHPNSCMISQSDTPSTLHQVTGTKKKLPHLNVQYYKATQKQIRSLRIEICRLKRSNKNFKTRLADAQKVSLKKSFENITKSMSMPAKLFTGMQFRETLKKAKGRRFTTEEKILSMALYKRSPKSYTLLSKCFTLPSTKSLKNLLGKIKIGPGINKLLFAKMKQTVANISDDDRLCVLVFDEMSINPQIHYNAASDELKGFTTIGPTKIADHALLFMVRGIKTKYKQPVAYYFTQSLNKLLLKEIIKDVIHNVKSTGLNIVATVCDQSMVNVGAIESLVNDTKALYLRQGKTWTNDMIIVDKSKIIPLYDTPHLFKGIRNNLINKDLKYIDMEDKKEKIVKWEYFQKIKAVTKDYRRACDSKKN